VMLENIVRHMEEGMKPFEAALKGAREIGFTIISITLSLVAVFIPIFFMGGVVGRLFREFAWVVTLAIGASAFVSLTLTPMLCARFLTPQQHGRKENWFGRVLEAGFEAVHGFYARTLDWCLNHRGVMLAVMLATVVGTIQLFQAIPKGFFPTEDTGQLQVSTEAAADIGFPAMAERQQKAAAIILAHPAVAYVTSSVGSGGISSTVNAGRMFVTLKPRGERPSASEVVQQLRRQLSGIPGFSVFMQPVQNLRVGGRSSKSMYQYTLQGLDLDQLRAWSDRLMGAMSATPGLQDVTTDLQLNNPQAYVHIDRAKAAMLGVQVDEVRATLYSAFGTRQISTIYTPANDYAVILELDPRYQEDAGALSKIYVRGDTNRLIPLDAFARVERTAGPLTVNHQGQLPAVTLSFNLAPGVSLGEAVEAIHGAERSIGLPASISTGFAGTAQVFQDAQASQGLLLLAAILVIYIVLGVLYESFLHPITILSGLPSAAVGALATLMLFGQELSVIAIIGILMLIGIVKKNAIMMIDFAIQARRDGGLAPLDAIRQACLLRFRPIMMTTMAALMGALPIALGEGASAELRQPLGLAVVGGLVVSQLLTLYITPVLYLWLEDLSRLAAPRKVAPVEHAPAE
ncbi:MAG TPA: efflux RND transporter permease subunit, partial [Azospirillaceae bacterium]|nr:efflux RND transporter permease subunit [Azospirillaceae bacterium]